MRGRPLLIIAAAGSILLSAACSSPASSGGTASSRTASTSPSASATASGADGPMTDWTSELDSRPTIVIAGPDGVYAATSGAAKFAPQIYRLAVDDGRQLARQTAVGLPNDLAIGPDGNLWIAGERHHDQPSGAGITIQSADSLAVIAHLGVPGTPLSLARVGSAMWVGSSGAVFVIDPSSREVTATLRIGGPAYQLLPLSDGAHILVAEGDALELLTVDGTSVARTPVVADGSIVTALAGDAAWVRVPIDVDSVLRAYSLPELVEHATGPHLDSVSGGVSVASGAAWAADDRTGQLVCVTPEGDATRAADGAVGVMGTVRRTGRDADELLLATATGVALRSASCEA